jgi:hypothetical protein
MYKSVQYGNGNEVVPMLNLTPCQEDMWENGATASPFLTSALDGISGQLHPLGRTPGTHWVGGLLGPKAGLDAVEETRICCPYLYSNPGLSANIQSTEMSRVPQINAILYY